jgi:hypothetical protein
MNIINGSPGRETILPLFQEGSRLSCALNVLQIIHHCQGRSRGSHVPLYHCGTGAGEASETAMVGIFVSPISSHVKIFTLNLLGDVGFGELIRFMRVKRSQI